MTKDEKDKIMKQLLADAGYDYEPKPRKDGDEIWTPCGQDIPKEAKPMSKETKDKLLKAKRSKRLKDFLDEDIYNELCQDEANSYINSTPEVSE